MTVLQSWMEKIPIRMQSTLLLSLRGPDTHACPNVKRIQRWMRGLAFRPGNPENVVEFMYVELPPHIEEKDQTAKEIEFCSQHFISHLMQGLKVIAYCYPGGAVSERARMLVIQICDLMHMCCETRGVFEYRLRELEWPEGRQPEDAREAVALLLVEDGHA